VRLKHTRLNITALQVHSDRISTTMSGNHYRTASKLGDQGPATRQSIDWHAEILPWGLQPSGASRTINADGSYPHYQPCQPRLGKVSETHDVSAAEEPIAFSGSVLFTICFIAMPQHYITVAKAKTSFARTVFYTNCIWVMDRGPLVTTSQKIQAKGKPVSQTTV
jgi:hypothetical protein